MEPSQKKIGKLACLEQAKIIIKKNQIAVAQRNDGLLADEDKNDADLFDFLLKQSKIGGNLDATYKKLVKQIHKSKIN